MEVKDINLEMLPYKIGGKYESCSTISNIPSNIYNMDFNVNIKSIWQNTQKIHSVNRNMPNILDDNKSN